MTLIRRTDGLHQVSGLAVAEGEGEERDQVQERGQQEPVPTQPGQDMQNTGQDHETGLAVNKDKP